MPIYEYKCDNGHVFDVMQRIADEPLTACQECGAPAERVMHPVAVHFKGSGFYNTDYGKKGAGPGSNGGGSSSGEAKSSESKSSDSSSGDSSKGDSKPAAAASD